MDCPCKLPELRFLVTRRSELEPVALLDLHFQQNVWQEIDTYIIENYYPHLPVHMMQRTTYDRLKLLVKERSIAKDEWQTQTGSGIPDGDPSNFQT